MLSWMPARPATLRGNGLARPGRLPPASFGSHGSEFWGVFAPILDLNSPGFSKRAPPATRQSRLSQSSLTPGNRHPHPPQKTSPKHAHTRANTSTSQPKPAPHTPKPPHYPTETTPHHTHNASHGITRHITHHKSRQPRPCGAGAKLQILLSQASGEGP